MKITIEGNRGEGKTTVAILVAQLLESRGFDVTLHDEPPGRERDRALVEMMRWWLPPRALQLARQVTIFGGVVPTPIKNAVHVTFVWGDGFTWAVPALAPLAGMYARHPRRLRPLRYRVEIGPGQLSVLESARLNHWLATDCEAALCRRHECLVKNHRRVTAKRSVRP